MEKRDIDAQEDHI